MGKRRTNAQIAQDQYVSEVNEYKYFIFDTLTGKIHTGFEDMADARYLLEDYQDDANSVKIYTKKHLINKLGVDVESVLTCWKNS